MISAIPAFQGGLYGKPAAPRPVPFGEHRRCVAQYPAAPVASITAQAFLRQHPA
ncbi:hypothetical protein [Sodalis glossinidius]|uniref:hypothetical protein n=1 Tax=Sodalis glossinidius TaxID=63612 RepID=UPI0013053D27|nr:hypothetical protein [Sodalis glossinidius]